MISQLRGTLIEKEPTEVVIDVGGVGFAVSIPLSTSSSLGETGETVTLLTQMTVREDDIHLYGFATKAERKLFSLLTTVSGIGPKMALNVLSCMSVEQFSAAVAKSDLKLLSKINGVGKRTAERLCVELRDKVSVDIGTMAAVIGSGKGTAANTAASEDAVLALVSLGFKREQSEAAVAKILEHYEGTPTAEGLLRRSLSLLNS